MFSDAEVVPVAVPGGSIAEAVDRLRGAAGTTVIDAANHYASNLWWGDEAARDVVERLNRDAGYDPVYTGQIENDAAQEALLPVIFAISEGMGPYVSRFAPLERS